jgi:DNA-binding GntR family transcriptional regulator
VTPLALPPLNATSLRDQAYAQLKNAITETNIYGQGRELRLDEREMTRALGVSRTPVREAISLLEQEGFLRTVPRRGIFIVRKSKRQIIEMIQMWAALESMAARLATLHAPDREIAKLRPLFLEFEHSPPSEHLDEYSDANLAFHQAVIKLGGSQLIEDRLAAYRGRDQEPLGSRACHPRGDNLAGQSCRALHHRSPQHHRGAGAT